jgi:antitoxin CptB
LDATQLNRLRWRCRRGMLENDLILARWLGACGAGMSDADVAALDRLLDLSDNELWDLLSGRSDVVDEELRPLLDSLRSA